MTETKISLIFIGNDETTLHRQFALFSDAADIKSKAVIHSRTIVEALNKHAHDKNTIIIVNLTANGLKELQFLHEIGDKHAAFIIVGDQKNVDLLSQAIHAGVKEFVDYRLYEDMLPGIFNDVKKSITHVSNGNHIKRLNAFINARGGSGVSFIASNVAYVLAKEAHLKVALLDLDLQFGSIGHNFDKFPKYTLTEALNAIDELDSVSLAAYMAKYNENLSLLLPSPSDILLPGELNVSHLKKLLDLLQANYSQIVVDLPRIIDPVSTLIMEQADHVTLVLQQNLAQFSDGRKLIQILNKELEIPLDKIVIVLNRYDPKNSLRMEDLKTIVNHDQIYLVASDYESIVTASNLGVPLCESSANTKIAQDIRLLAQKLGKADFEKKDSRLLGRFSALFSKS